MSLKVKCYVIFVGCNTMYYIPNTWYYVSRGFLNMGGASHNNHPDQDLRPVSSLLTTKDTNVFASDTAIVKVARFLENGTPET